MCATKLLSFALDCASSLKTVANSYRKLIPIFPWTKMGGAKGDQAANGGHYLPPP